MEVNSTQVIPLKETLSREDFEVIYPGVNLEEMDVFIHPFWRWDVHVVSYDPEEVTIWHQPVYNKEYLAFPWNVTVVDISTSRNVITLQHDITEIGRTTKVPFIMVRSYDPKWVENAMTSQEGEPMEGIVTSKGGVITIDFNQETAGKTLYFQITINSIKRE